MISLHELRVSGAVLWNPIERELIASYVEGTWVHHGLRSHNVSVSGPARLLFGITREPTIMSEPVDRFDFIGPTLVVDGIVIAEYIEQQDTWHGTIRPMWWLAMRIVNASEVSTGAQETDPLVVNLSNPLPSQKLLAVRDTNPQTPVTVCRRPPGKHP